MDNVFKTVDGGDLALTAFVGASGYGDFIVFADGDGADLRKVRINDCECRSKFFERYTLYFSRSSLLSGALIKTRTTLEGAVKWALRDFLREEWRALKD